MTTAPDPTSYRLLSALADEGDPTLTRIVDRARRRDGLLPSRAAIESGPLSEAGEPTELFYLGGANDDDYLLAATACEALLGFGNAAERELATLSLAVLEASSIVYRRTRIVSRSVAEADHRIASAAAALHGPWQRLATSALRSMQRASA